jgi:hypothetical protein
MPCVIGYLYMNFMRMYDFMIEGVVKRYIWDEEQKDDLWREMGERRHLLKFVYKGRRGSWRLSLPSSSG